MGRFGKYPVLGWDVLRLWACRVQPESAGLLKVMHVNLGRRGEAGAREECQPGECL